MLIPPKFRTKRQIKCDFCWHIKAAGSRAFVLFLVLILVLLVVWQEKKKEDENDVCTRGRADMARLVLDESVYPGIGWDLRCDGDKLLHHM